MFVFDGKYSDVHPNAQFFFGKTLQQISCETFYGKTI